MFQSQWEAVAVSRDLQRQWKAVAVSRDEQRQWEPVAVSRDGVTVSRDRGLKPLMSAGKDM